MLLLKVISHIDGLKREINKLNEALDDKRYELSRSYAKSLTTYSDCLSQLKKTKGDDIFTVFVNDRGGITGLFFFMPYYLKNSDDFQARLIREFLISDVISEKNQHDLKSVSKLEIWGEVELGDAEVLLSRLPNLKRIIAGDVSLYWTLEKYCEKRKITLLEKDRYVDYVG